MTRMTADNRLDLDKTFADTYFVLRWALVVIAVVLPPFLVIGRAVITRKFELLPSLSDYYCSNMRDWFVGLLFAAAAGLYIYKGLSDKEDKLLNAAAVFAAGTAVNPVWWQPPWWSLPVKPHYVFAVLFFVTIALVCWLCQDDSLNLKLIPPVSIRRYRAKYVMIGLALVFFPVLAVVLSYVDTSSPKSPVFWAEAAAIWVFAYYWYTKSGELKMAIDRGRVGRGKL